VQSTATIQFEIDYFVQFECTVFRQQTRIEKKVHQIEDDLATQKNKLNS